MALRCMETPLPGVRLFAPDVFRDSRGFFMEVFHERKYAALGLEGRMVQVNLSRSAKGILRGLHYQLHHPQAKLLGVLQGAIYDVAVDIRRGSPTFGRWFGTMLEAEQRRQMFVPAGFAHGFCVMSDTAEVLYQCSDYYAPEDERGIAWDDPAIGIAWPLEGPPVLSDRDRRHPRLAEADPGALPVYQPDGSPGAPPCPS